MLLEYIENTYYSSMCVYEQIYETSHVFAASTILENKS